MIRHCDGTDPNLTRDLQADEYDPDVHTLSPWHTRQHGKRGIMRINCQCGLRFDDVDCTVIYPHERVSGSPRRYSTSPSEGVSDLEPPAETQGW